MSDVRDEASLVDVPPDNGDPGYLYADGDTAFMRAAGVGDVDRVKTFLSIHGSSLLWHRDAAGETPLHRATKGEHEEIVRLLLAQDKQICLQLINPEEFLSPSSLPCENCGRSPKKLLNAGVNSYQALVPSEIAKVGGYSALRIAVRQQSVSIVRRILQQKTSSDEPIAISAGTDWVYYAIVSSGKTPAGQSTCIEICSLLVSAGCSTDQPDRSGYRVMPIETAKRLKLEQVVTWLAGNKGAVLLPPSSPVSSNKYLLGTLISPPPALQQPNLLEAGSTTTSTAPPVPAPHPGCD